MYRTALSFPVLSGRTPTDVTAIARQFESRPEEYRKSRARLGVTLERAYVQKTPMGDFVIAYIESDKPGGEWMGTLATSDLPLDMEFIKHIKENHGVDVTQPPSGAHPETIGEWVDSDVTTRRRGMAFCAPVIPGREEAGRAFTKQAFETRRTEMTASRRAIDQNVEVVTLQHTPMGPVVCVYLEGTDPWSGNRTFAASKSDFDTWFKAEVSTIFPPTVDINKPIEGVTEIFDSEKLLVTR